ncbi:2Fe-2S iron-sulfur cluster-binding protein [Pararhodonellum marinum]|uniref:2Fe-2S iron-sulfur cluster-binding protein n=1 Tax=Pararhodonellum marinum TaxID=2755358 RepID=UPI00188DE220|nr:2Fe-2S iron-sulfur cluster-binding protein [Pararhodonellum marinum]
MAKIVIENLFNKEITTRQSERKVIELIHENYIDWMHACGKKGRCTTCKMEVISGMENLAPLTGHEQIFREDGRLKAHQRLSCQAKLLKGTLIIRVAEENKFPHLTYSN